MRKPSPAATPGTTRGESSSVAQSVAPAQPPALERQRRRGADRQGQRHRARGDQEAVHGGALELRIGQHVDVPAQRKARAAGRTGWRSG